MNVMVTNVLRASAIRLAQLPHGLDGRFPRVLIMSWSLPRAIVAAIFLLMGSFFTAANGAENYTLSLLPPADTSSGSIAIDVNEKGEVLGYNIFGNPFNPRAFLWSKQAGYVDIPVEQLAEQLGVKPGRTVVTKINNKGEVAGYLLYNPAQEQFAGSVAFLWSASKGFQQILNPPIPDVLAQARTVNDAGQVAGDIDLHAYRWSEQAGLQGLGTLGPQGSQSLARGINNMGSVVGMSIAPTEPLTWHAFLWRANSGLRDLGTLPGYANSGATAVNDRGQIIGYSYEPGRRAFIWSDKTGLEEMSTKGSAFLDLNPSDINNHSEVVGDASGRAFIWTASKGPIDLNTLIAETTLTLETASATSDNGLVVGSARVGFSQRGYILTPVGKQCPRPSQGKDAKDSEGLRTPDV